MSRAIRRASIAGAVLMAGLAAVPLSGVADRLLPHAVRLWDTHQCAPSDRDDHALFGVGAPEPGSGTVRILDAHPLGLPPGVRWRAWVRPVPPGGGRTGSLSTASPPAGWADRVPAAGAEVTGDRAVEVLPEVWPGEGGDRTAVRGFLVTYRGALGLPRTVRTRVDLTTRPRRC